ncbi:cell division protein PerM [Microbacterium terricola]|uniref:Integral membrane protein n=1 Tax=Microbacterium terricola TaxID=344163 RepID=A0ABM8DWN7_9MICO|nr:DUF6350 family protein [Microbacterium terricola]UYK39370.1 DUF6350 family protein [Microbacterium terricola]BDV29906.1 hypothetical protein Microterr_05660 [Microbacterium terricola]
MHRLTVALLVAIDAAIAAAVGLAVFLAPLTLLWVFVLGADPGDLWPTAGTLWQFAHLVPLTVTLPDAYLAATGIDAKAASFVLSLAPLALTAFTAIFAARSGVRASRAEAWLTGVVVGGGVFAVLAWLVGATSANDLATVVPWQAVLLPALVFALPSLGAAIITEWREAGAGPVAALRDRIESSAGGWGALPGLVARGAAVAIVGLIGLGAAVVAIGLVLRADQVVTLFEAGNVDALGAILLTLAQLAYLPTLVIWGLAFAAGPGFAVGPGTAVSPAGTQVGVVPGVPLLGAIPESTSTWLLLLALVPVALGAFAGWIARSRTARAAGGEAVAPRVVIAAGIALTAAAAAALLSLLASGSIGPGNLAQVGPDAGAVALAVGVEVAIGAGILLLSPRSHSGDDLVPLTADPVPQVEADGETGAGERRIEDYFLIADDDDRVPAPDPQDSTDAAADPDATVDLSAELGFPPEDDPDRTLDLGPRGDPPRPPVD